MEILLDESSCGEDDSDGSSSDLVQGDPEDLVDEDDDDEEDASDDGGPEIVKVGIGSRYLILTFTLYIMQFHCRCYLIPIIEAGFCGLHALAKISHICTKRVKKCHIWCILNNFLIKHSQYFKKQTPNLQNSSVLEKKNSSILRKK